MCRYRLLPGPETPRSLSLARLNDLMAPHLAGEVRLKGVQKEELFGWVKPIALEKVAGAPALDDPTAHWDLSDCQVDDGLLLRLRLERRKVPAALLQLIYKRRLYELVAKGGKQPSPQARRDLRDEIQRDLLGQALPTLAHVDAYWRTRHEDILLFATGKKVRERFEALFNASFAEPLGYRLVSLDPPLQALSRDQWLDSDVASATLGRLSSTTPVAFAQQDQS